MPRITPIPTAGKAPPSAPDSPMRKAQLANLAANIGTESATVATRILEQRESARRASDYASLKAKAHKILGDESIGALRLPPREAEQAFLENTQNRLQALLDGIEDDVVRQALEEDLPGMVETRRFGVAKDAFGREIKEGRDDLQSNVLPDLVGSYAGAENDLERERIAKDARRSVGISEYFNEAEKKELNQKWRAAAQEARVQRLINEGDPDTAQDLIENRNQTPDIGDKERISLRNTIDAEKGRIAEREWSNLEIEIDRAGPDADFDLFDREVDRLFDEGAISGPKRAQLKHDVQKKRLEVEDLVARRERIWAAWDGEPGALLFPRNTDDKKDVAEFYNSTIKPQLGELNPAERSVANVEASVRLNMVPKPLQEETHAKIRGGTTEQVIEAASYLEGLRTSDKPELLSDFSDEDIATGMLIASSIRAGVPADAAVKQAREALQASPQERDVRERIWQSEGWADDLRFIEADKAFRGAHIPDWLRGEYELLARNFFLASGDIDVAMQMAEDTLKRLWAVTDINGERWQRLAPEAMYPEFQGDSEAIHEQIVTDLLEGSINGKLTLPEAEDWEDRIRLEPDAMTQREVFPSYVIQYQNDDGEFEPIEMKNGKIARFTPNYATSPAYLREQQAKAEEGIHDRAQYQINMARRQALARNPELARKLATPLVGIR